MTEHEIYWIRYGLIWFAVNGSIASAVHFGANIPWRGCFNLYVAFAFLIIGLAKAIYGN